MSVMLFLINELNTGFIYMYALDYIYTVAYFALCQRDYSQV